MGFYVLYRPRGGMSPFVAIERPFPSRKVASDYAVLYLTDHETRVVMDIPQKRPTPSDPSAAVSAASE